ncbi:uncharacterized protein TM35_000222550 [Trypanosoma theileri]|uniref:Uncharacterized protein n=1 Tax=Trypanosoma theileri TaxID=67003 RepID=A0A1X0NRW8_9TRYP|nr:uncharacterized protein TM35_000222550 [Trypanosoma theileri]ORC87456.1 hypothetical protein TM35_000222550 [Trypanosoma theileri]
MSLPIIRLHTVDSNNATLADDPVAASCTLYTFLRSVPSWVECEMAMSDFKKAVQATRGHSHLSKNNEKTVNRIYAAVHERFHSRPPTVLPAIARQTCRWRSVLRGSEEMKTTGSNTPPTRSQDLTHATQEDECSTQQPVHTPLSSSNTSIINNNDPVMVVVKETVPAKEMRFENPYEQTYLPAEWPVASATARNAVAKISPSADVEKEKKEEKEEEGKDIHSGYMPHPMLRTALEQLRSTVPAEESDDDRREREFATMMESKATAIHTKLSSTLSMIPPEEKECVSFLQQIATRLAVAKKLFEVQKYEEETIQITHCALKLEIATMRDILNKVVDAVAEVEERHEREGPHSPHYAEECHIMAAIQRALDELPS